MDNSFTATDLAVKLNVTPGTIRRWSNEESGFPPAFMQYVGYRAIRYWNLNDVCIWLKARRDGG